MHSGAGASVIRFRAEGTVMTHLWSHGIFKKSRILLSFFQKNKKINCKVHITQNSPSEPFLSVQLRGIKHIQIAAVHLQNFTSQTDTLSPLNANSPTSSPSPWPSPSTFSMVSTPLGTCYEWNHSLSTPALEFLAPRPSVSRSFPARTPRGAVARTERGSHPRAESVAPPCGSAPALGKVAMLPFLL